MEEKCSQLLPRLVGADKRAGMALKAHAALARDVGARCCVLLKNENRTLPLRKGAKVLAADESGFVTGVDIPVEGGRILGPHNCDM